MVPAQSLSRILAIQPLLDAVGRDQAAPRAMFEHLTIGQNVTGQVLSQANGEALIHVAGQNVAMRLPYPVADGDTLKFQYAGSNPQPAFMLDTTEAVDSATPLFSPTAKLLSTVVNELSQRIPPTLTALQPVLPAPSANAAELANALHTALTRSGLFYESHLADWVVGRDSLQGLRQEPQNRLGELSASSMADTTLQLQDSKSANASLTLLTHQLRAMDTAVIAWKGELWPGQPMEWQLHREDTPSSFSDAHSDLDKGTWQSSLKLTLPRLGTVAITLKLDARRGLSVDMESGLAATTPLLQQQQARLSERLATTGCTHTRVKVHHNGNL